MKVIYLEWMDAVGNSAWIGTKSECTRWAEESGHYVREVGFLVEETKEFILFAQRYHPEDPHTQENYGAIHKIPKTWIKNRKILADIK